MLEYSKVKIVMYWAKLFEGKWKDCGLGLRSEGRKYRSFSELSNVILPKILIGVKFLRKTPPQAQ
jgi:hypothetical protein